MEVSNMTKIQYINKDGKFKLENPEMTSYLYFPIANEAGMMSSVTPYLGGDSKTTQNTFVISPVSSENLHNDKSSRNIWCKMNRESIWSATGKSERQQVKLFSKEKEKTILEAQFMYHSITRESKELGVKSHIENFVPCDEVTVEIMAITLQNISNKSMSLQPITAIPLYARSADNIRDHRHVTSLLHRIETMKNGIVVHPTLTFDERGHQKNEMAYGVFGTCQGEEPIGFLPTVEEFIGEGGNFENPRPLYQDFVSLQPAGTKSDGYEAMGAMVFREYQVEPGEEICLLVVIGMESNKNMLIETASRFLTRKQVVESKNKTIAHWNDKVNVSYQTANKDFNHWMRWVSFQPLLRRIYGCSFLPHHDYGKGGRGWRDLWQDCLALLMMEPQVVRQMLIDNFGGVRMDGTNATIIGKKQGEFVADRNNITRVWMDHGVWPLLTTDLYIQQTGDLSILLSKNNYFKDIQAGRGEEKDLDWTDDQGNKVRDKSGKSYQGTLLEHLLIQHLTAFYDVGEHNHIRIRGADWNDALDLAKEHGESVAFTTMYASNLERLGDLLLQLNKKGITEVSILEELMMLIKVDPSVYKDIIYKQKLLKEYCKICKHQVSGSQVTISCIELASILKKKGIFIKEHIRKQEWITLENGYSWYNGYYDNQKKQVEGIENSIIKMMLTSQVFALMSETATKEQVKQIIKSADQYLFDKTVGGYRLNTDFHEIKMDFGRMFGFAYGHKENGAVFSHMAVMYANALYSRGEAKAGYKVINTLFEHCNDFKRSKIYPGIPEYIDARGRGMYHYLTGAASWLLVTVITKMYGVKGELGDLVFAPQLLKEQFDENQEAGLTLQFAGKSFQIVYHNPTKLSPSKYRVISVSLDGQQYERTKNTTCILKEDITSLSDALHVVRIELSE